MDSKVQVKIRIKGEVMIVKMKEQCEVNKVVNFLREQRIIFQNIRNSELFVKNFNGVELNVDQSIGTILPCSREGNRQITIDWREQSVSRQPIPTQQNVQYQSASQEIFKKACEYLISHDKQSLRILYEEKKISKQLFVLMHKLSDKIKLNGNIDDQKSQRQIMKQSNSQALQKQQMMRAQLLSQIQNLQRQNSKIYAQLNSLQKQNQNLKRQMKDLQSKSTQLQKQMQKFMKQSQIQQEQFNSQKVQKSKLNKQIQSIKFIIQSMIEQKQTSKLLKQQQTNLSNTFGMLSKLQNSLQNKFGEIFKKLQYSHNQSEVLQNSLLQSINSKKGGNQIKLHKSKTFQINIFSEALQQASLTLTAFLQKYTRSNVKQFRVQYFDQLGSNSDRNFINGIKGKKNIILLFSTKEGNKLFGIFSPLPFPEKEGSLAVKATKGFLFTLIDNNMFQVKEKQCLWTSSHLQLKIGPGALVMGQTTQNTALKLKKKKQLSKFLDLGESKEKDILGSEKNQIELASFQCLTVHFESQYKYEEETPGGGMKIEQKN